jgi:hypothetical protein
VGSDETGPKTRCANQIDCSQDVVGEYAEGGFGFDSIETSGEEAPACCHSFDSSKWVLGSARRRRMRPGSASTMHLGFSAQSAQSSATYRMLRFLVRTCLRTRVRPAGQRKVSV